MSKAEVWGLTCRNSPEEIGRARRWTRDVLAEHSLADDAALIVSELGTNALRHTASGDQAGTFRLTLTVSAGTLAISLTDEGSKLSSPQVQHPGAEATHGRGLGMVAILAHHIEITGNHLGRTVTAELLMPHQEGPAR